MRPSIKTMPVNMQSGVKTNPAADLALLKKLVWLYFWLLIFEGALRKWVAPQLSNPLLIVRDPVVLLIYMQAARYNLFPRRAGLWAGLTGLFLASLALALIQVANGIPVEVLIYGLRSDYMHLPLVFLLPRIFDSGDIRKMGQWFLLLAIPMLLLMAYQFQSPPDAWINRAVGTGPGQQLPTAMGRIRPPGTFSFITGPVSFYAVVAAFLCYGAASKQAYSRWLLLACLASTGLGLAVSGSRAAVLSTGIVLATFILGLAAAKRATAGVSRFLFMLVVALGILAYVENFEEGTEVLTERFKQAGEIERVQGGLAGRFLSGFTEPLKHLLDIPLTGFGLGVGTNVGAKLLTGEIKFLLSEGEWGRVIFEMGPLLGLAFVFYRLALAIKLGKLAYKKATEGHILGLLLFSSIALNVISGQWGQPTTLGFFALITGLAWAAIEHPDIQTTTVPQTRRAGHIQRGTGRRIPLG